MYIPVNLLSNIDLPEPLGPNNNNSFVLTLILLILYNSDPDMKRLAHVKILIIIYLCLLIWYPHQSHQLSVFHRIILT